MRFNDKIVLVTGANFGIGNAIARKFAGEGAKIAIVARGQERSEKVVEAFAAEGFTADFFKTDVSDEKAVEGMIAAVLAKYGHIDVVVNNAGCGSQNCGITPDDSPGKRWAFFRGANLD